MSVTELSLRSALQQYHTIFIRAGVLLCPYIDKLNTPGPGGSPARLGRRIPILYNLTLDYQHLNPKHAGRRISLKRTVLDGSGDVELCSAAAAARRARISGSPGSRYIGHAGTTLATRRVGAQAGQLRS
jgi:hypothetical protein